MDYRLDDTIQLKIVIKYLRDNTTKWMRNYGAEAMGLQTGRSSSKLGRARSIGLLSKKLTGLRSKLDDTVGITGKSSWHGM